MLSTSRHCNCIVRYVRGYSVVKEQHVIICGIFLTNYVLEKETNSNLSGLIQRLHPKKAESVSVISAKGDYLYAETTTWQPGIPMLSVTFPAVSRQKITVFFAPEHPRPESPPPDISAPFTANRPEQLVRGGDHIHMDQRGSFPSSNRRIISRVRLMPSSLAGMASRENHSAEASSSSSSVTVSSSPSRSQK